MFQTPSPLGLRPLFHFLLGDLPLQDGQAAHLIETFRHKSLFTFIAPATGGLFTSQEFLNFHPLMREKNLCVSMREMVPKDDMGVSKPSLNRAEEKENIFKT